MTEQLKPCPFCQGQAELLLGAHDFNGAEVQCKECGASSGHFENDAKGKGATAHWNRRAQPAQEVPRLTDEEIDALYDAVKGKGWALDFARAIEQAVLAKRVPMTPEDWSVFNSGAEVASGLTWAEAWDYMTPSRIERGWTAVCVANKSNIGIVGEKGGA